MYLIVNYADGGTVTQSTADHWGREITAIAASDRPVSSYTVVLHGPQFNLRRLLSSAITFASPTPTRTFTPIPTATPVPCLLTPVTLVFGGSNGIDITQPFDPIALGLPEQIPAWVPVATEVRRYTGSKQGTALAVVGDYSDAEILIIGFSAGGDAAVMYAEHYLSSNEGCGRIRGIAILGGTLTGTMINGANLMNEWPNVFDRLLFNSVDIYVLNDDAAYGDETANYAPPVSAPGVYVYVDHPQQQHWQGGYPGTGTNNNDQFRTEVLSWFSSN